MYANAIRAVCKEPGKPLKSVIFRQAETMLQKGATMYGFYNNIVAISFDKGDFNMEMRGREFHGKVIFIGIDKLANPVDMPMKPRTFIENFERLEK